jgi:hypothetical protein
MSPSGRVAQLYPQALGSLFVTFYILQGCDEVILHTRYCINYNKYLEAWHKSSIVIRDGQYSKYEMKSSMYQNIILSHGSKKTNKELFPDSIDNVKCLVLMILTLYFHPQCNPFITSLSFSLHDHHQVSLFVCLVLIIYHITACTSGGNKQEMHTIWMQKLKEVGFLEDQYREISSSLSRC